MTANLSLYPDASPAALDIVRNRAKLVRHLLCSLLLVLAVGSTGRCLADDAKDGPSVLFQDSFIENLIGEWNLSRRFPGKMVHNRVSAQWVLNHQFVQLHMIDVESPPKYEALVLIGYDHTAQEYVAHWCDLFGARYSAIGRGKLANGGVAFMFSYSDGPFVNTFTWNPKDKTWTSYMENISSDGSRRFFAEDTYRRAR
jgi:hypothetical protein